MAHPSARELALAALREWRGGERFADAILGRILSSSDLASADRAFATELFYGVLRNLMLLDFWIDALRSRHLDHDARDLLRLGLYQLFLLQTPQHAAVYETVAVAAAKQRSLINAVLRNSLRRKDELLDRARHQPLSIGSSHPPFLVDRWTRHFGATEAAALCEWNNRPAPLYARINHLKISDEAFVDALAEAERLPGRENFVRLGTLPKDSLAAGHCYIQDPSTAAACELLDPQPGENVLDACAAPGGKTGYLVELMKNQGSILACDRDEGRIRILKENMERLGVGIARFAHHDWTSGEPSGNPRESSSFDRILVDAPCSNTGVMRRRVDLRWRLSPKDFSRMPDEQLRILRSTIPLLKAGGVLVYSTCSIEPEENKAVIDTIVGEFDFLKFVEERSLLPFRDEFDGAYAAKLIRPA
jgi:16S rRNA (cytosine967-C5)-methyltransferase